MSKKEVDVFAFADQFEVISDEELAQISGGMSTLKAYDNAVLAFQDPEMYSYVHQYYPNYFR